MEGGKERGERREEDCPQGISLGVAVQVVFIEDACRGGRGGGRKGGRERGRRDGREDCPWGGGVSP